MVFSRRVVYYFLNKKKKSVMMMARTGIVLDRVKVNTAGLQNGASTASQVAIPIVV